MDTATTRTDQNEISVVFIITLISIQLAHNLKKVALFLK
jgi:hypothetical protein